jgi:hypothetical protein
MKKLIFVVILLFVIVSPSTADEPKNSSGLAPQNISSGSIQTENSISAYAVVGVYGFGSYIAKMNKWEEAYPIVDQTYFAGDFMPGDSNKLYVLDYHWYELDVFDVSTNTNILIGQSKPRITEQWTGMTGAINGLMYASASDCLNHSTLYTINLKTGAATIIDNIRDANCVIDIVSFPNGKMYGIDIYDDTFIEINPTNGLTQIIGSIGFNANYAQGMDYEVATQTLYYAAFNQDTNQGELRTIDIVTGNTTFIETINDGIQVEVIAFPDEMMLKSYIPIITK